MTELMAAMVDFALDCTMLRLGKHEIYSLPTLHCTLRICSGIAWITGDGKDIILQSGEQATMDFHKKPVLVGVFKGDELVVEVSRARKRWRRLARAVQT